MLDSGKKIQRSQTAFYSTQFTMEVGHNAGKYIYRERDHGNAIYIANGTKVCKSWADSCCTLEGVHV